MFCQECDICVLPCDACFNMSLFFKSSKEQIALSIAFNMLLYQITSLKCVISQVFLRQNTKTLLTFFRSEVLGSDGDSLLEIDSSSEYSQNAMDLFKACGSSQEDTEDTEIAEGGFLKV